MDEFSKFLQINLIWKHNWMTHHLVIKWYFVCSRHGLQSAELVNMVWRGDGRDRDISARLASFTYVVVLWVQIKLVKLSLWEFHTQGPVNFQVGDCLFCCWLVHVISSHPVRSEVNVNDIHWFDNIVLACMIVLPWWLSGAEKLGLWRCLAISSIFNLLHA